MKNIKLLTSIVFIVLFSLLLLPLNVSAQYDSDGLPSFPGEDGGEIFGVNVSEGDTATFFPGGCEIIESVNIKANKDISGSITVKSLGRENPVNDRDLGKKVVEFCEIGFDGFAAEDIESSVFRIKGGKDDLDELNLDSNDLRLFQFNENDEKWEQLDTIKKSESTLNFFYEVDQVNQYTYFAAAEKLSSFQLGTLPFVICGFLLLLLVIILLILASLGRRDEDRDGRKR
ncbi:MAG TPA: PGF-pre-PGF domain-containing protein [bacterium]|nr:PGF-pre-PGF domain-containing protein [bacterium]